MDTEIVGRGNLFLSFLSALWSYVRSEVVKLSELLWWLIQWYKFWQFFIILVLGLPLGPLNLNFRFNIMIRAELAWVGLSWWMCDFFHSVLTVLSDLLWGAICHFPYFGQAAVLLQDPYHFSREDTHSFYWWWEPCAVRTKCWLLKDRKSVV